MLFKVTQNHEHSTSGHLFHKLQSSRKALCVFGRRLQQRDIQQMSYAHEQEQMPQAKHFLKQRPCYPIVRRESEQSFSSWVVDVLCLSILHMHAGTGSCCLVIINLLCFADITTVRWAIPSVKALVGHHRK